jgi:hypothetical protein
VDRDDVGMAERARQPRFAQEALREGRLRLAEATELLERDEAVKVALTSEEDGGHAPAAKLLEDLVAANGPRDAIAHPPNLRAPAAGATSPQDRSIRLRSHLG